MEPRYEDRSVGWDHPTEEGAEVIVSVQGILGYDDEKGPPIFDYTIYRELDVEGDPSWEFISRKLLEELVGTDNAAQAVLRIRREVDEKGLPLL